tara:strand:+ start:1325 stop:1597 length:273 start_codon:yes stop_codon:yes gene_type:complete
MGDVKDTLAEREKIHGDYRQVAAVAQSIKDALDCHRALFQDKFSPAQRESLDQIATKMARIVCGDPNIIDHWLDIEGYARLVRKILEKKE